MKQQVTKLRKKGKTLIGNISFNFSTKLIHCNVISTDEISDHVEAYAIFSIKKERFQKRYKYVRDEKNLDMNKYILDFKQLSTRLVYAFDEPDDKISVLNKLLNQCISEHIPMTRVKFTCHPAPWMKDPKISKAKNVLVNLQTKSRDLNYSDITVRQNCQSARYHHKKITSKKPSFLQKAKEVWETAHRILDPPKNASIKILKVLINILQN